MHTAHEFFLDELHDIYNAEKRILGVLQEGEQQIQRFDLKKAFLRHRRQTEGQVKRLEAVFESLGEEPREKNCEGLEGLVKEKESLQEEQPEAAIADLNSLVAAIKVERYEISAYEVLIFLAQQMKHREAVRLLKETLKEEQETAKLLLEICKATDMDWEAGMNEEAGEGEDEAESRRAMASHGRARSRRAA